MKNSGEKLLQGHCHQELVPPHQSLYLLSFPLLPLLRQSLFDLST